MVDRNNYPYSSVITVDFKTKPTQKSLNLPLFDSRLSLYHLVFRILPFNTMKLVQISCLLLLNLLVTGVYGQNNAHLKEIVAYPLNEVKLKMDGKIDEDFWLGIPASGDFHMTVPVEGGAPTQKTEIRIAYDDENLYIGAILFDTDPSGIKAFKKKRDDGLNTDDRFMMIFDTFNDKRRGYFFETNPHALRGDGLVAAGGGGRRVNKDWDGIWKAWTEIGDFGWSVEMKIPFRTLNFDPNADSWGVNFQRTIRRNNEELLWTGYRRNQGLFRPQNAGTMRGLQNPSQGVGLEVIPYGLATTSRTPDSETGQLETTNNAEFGFDVNYNITSSLKASFTYNTDFAQTEVDDRQINLTRFPLRFPERRDFFLEGATILQFASRSGAEPYFSRRIGLSGGVPAPINYGARMLGNVGKNNIYLLHVNTGATEEQKPEHFTVGRYRYDFLEESSIGMIYTRRDTNGDEMLDSLQTRHTVGFDLNLNTSKLFGDQVFQFSAFVVAHNDPSPYNDSTTTWDRSARGVRINFPNQPWRGWASYREFGDHYDPAVGFNRRNGFRRFQPAIRYEPLFEESDVLRSIEWGFFYEYLASLNNQLLTENLSLTLGQVQFESGERFELEVSRNFEFLDEDFDILRDGTVIIRPGEYSNWRYSIEASSASFRKVSVSLRHSGGGFWTGTNNRYGIDLRFRPYSGVFLGAEYRHNRVAAEGGSFNTNLFRIDFGLDFTPDLSISTNIQYDNISQLLGTNSRFRWIITPGTDIFLVYNHNWVNDPMERWSTIQSGLALKAVYTHRF